MPYEMYSKDMEIPTVSMKFTDEGEHTGLKLYIVPDQLKRRLNISKEYRIREKIGAISFSIPGEGEDTEDEMEFDEDEQAFYKKDNGIKFNSLYGSNDLRDVPVYKLQKSGDLLVEVPQFRNFMMHNVLTESLMDVLKPSCIHLALELEEINGKTVDKPSLLSAAGSEKVLQSVSCGSASVLDGATASFVSGTLSSGIAIRFVAVPGPSRGNLYL